MFVWKAQSTAFFWQTTFSQQVAALLQFTTFQACRYGSKRPKRTMLGFNVDEVSVINKMCEGTSSTHRHEKWGIDASCNKFATALETAYPMPLVRMIATQFVVALQRMGIAMPHETLAHISQHDAAVLSALRAQVGNQPKASRLPPLIPQFAARLAITGFREDLPMFEVNHKLSAALEVKTTNAPTKVPNC